MSQTTVKTRFGGTLDRNAVLAMCCVGLFVYSIDRAAFPPVFPLVMNDLHLEYAVQGALYSGFFVGFLALPFLAGSLSDRFGRARMMVAGLLVFSAATFLTGTARGFGDAFVWRVLTGVGEGMFWAPTIALVTSLFPTERRGRVLGILNGAYPFGLFAGSALAGVLADATGSWRMPFYVSGLLSLAVALGLFLLVVEQQQEKKATTAENSRPWGIFRERNVIIAAVAYLAFTWSSWAVNAWLPTFLAQDRGLGITVAALVTGSLGLLGVAGMVVGGAMSDRIGRKAVLAFTALSFALMIIGLLEFSSLPLLILTVVIGSLLSGALLPSIQAVAADAVPASKTGAALGLVVNVSAVSGIVSPIIAGQVAQTSSLHDALLLPVVIPLVLIVFLTPLLRPRTRTETVPEVVPSTA